MFSNHFNILPLVKLIMFLNENQSMKNPFWMYLVGSFIIIVFSIIGQLPLSYVISGQNLIEAGGDPMLALRNLNKNIQLFYF